MNYYEELGLARNATADEIRQAYRNLVRLLHPDQLADATLRRLGENQMKRLNSINEVLTDPVRRRQYDDDLGKSLTVAAPAPCSSGPKLRPLGRDAVLFLMGLVAASLYWQLLAPRVERRTAASPAPKAAGQLPTAPQGKSRPQRASPQRKASARMAATTSGIATTRAEHDSLLVKSSSNAPQLDQLSEGPSRQQLSVPVQPDLASYQPTPPALVSPPVMVAPGFSGTWVYVRPRVPDSGRSRYPAEYVEAVIVEEAGVLSGRYRGRFQVADRPISSEVTFRFEGKAHGETAGLRWEGAGGARGELSLKLLGINSLQMDWIATALGNQLGLGSGTAVLTRRVEPSMGQP